MKMRLGYVSNSSSSSFCIMGFYRSKEDIREVLKSFLKEGESPDEEGDFEDDGYCLLSDGLKYEFGLDEYYDSVVFGLSVKDMREDETLSQFKDRVFRSCKYPGVKREEIDWHVDGGNDY